MVSKSIGLCMMTLMAPFSWASGITMFSRASDSGTSSTTDGGISISLSSMKAMPCCSALAFMTSSASA